MYNVQLDENMFYTGSYAKVGTINNGINVETLPPTENSLCYKLVDVEVTVNEDRPILQYFMRTASETEFTTSYWDNGTGFPITEGEYNNLTDDEKVNITVTQTPVVIHTELTKEEYDALEDKTNTIITQKTDEHGDLVCETVEVTKIVKQWQFFQERYDEMEAAKLAAEEAAKSEAEYQESISNETLKAENEALTEQVAILTDCLLEMSALVYA